MSPSAKLVPITRALLKEFYTQFPLEPVPVNEAQQHLQACKALVAGLPPSKAAAAVDMEVPKRVDDCCWRARMFCEEIAFSLQQLASKAAAIQQPPGKGPQVEGQNEEAEGHVAILKELCGVLQAAAQCVEDVQRSNTDSAAAQIKRFLPQDFRANLLEVKRQATERSNKKAVDDLVRKGGTIRQRYELYLQQQWERREALVQMGQLSGIWKMLVKYLGGVPQVLLDFAKEINAPLGPMEEQRIKYGPELYVVCELGNGLNVVAAHLLDQAPAVNLPQAVAVLQPAVRFFCSHLTRVVQFLGELFIKSPFFISADVAQRASLCGTHPDPELISQLSANAAATLKPVASKETDGLGGVAAGAEGVGTSPASSTSGGAGEDAVGPLSCAPALLAAVGIHSGHHHHHAHHGQLGTSHSGRSSASGMLHSGGSTRASADGAGAHSTGLAGRYSGSTAVSLPPGLPKPQASVGVAAAAAVPAAVGATAGAGAKAAGSPAQSLPELGQAPAGGATVSVDARSLSDVRGASAAQGSISQVQAAGQLPTGKGPASAQPASHTLAQPPLVPLPQGPLPLQAGQASPWAPPKGPSHGLVSVFAVGRGPPQLQEELGGTGAAAAGAGGRGPGLPHGPSAPGVGVAGISPTASMASETFMSCLDNMSWVSGSVLAYQASITKEDSITLFDAHGSASQGLGHAGHSGVLVGRSSSTHQRPSLPTIPSQGGALPQLAPTTTPTVLNQGAQQAPGAGLQGGAAAGADAAAPGQRTASATGGVPVAGAPVGPAAAQPPARHQVVQTEVTSSDVAAGIRQAPADDTAGAPSMAGLNGAVVLPGGSAAARMSGTAGSVGGPAAGSGHLASSGPAASVGIMSSDSATTHSPYTHRVRRSGSGGGGGGARAMSDVTTAGGATLHDGFSTVTSIAHQDSRVSSQFAQQRAGLEPRTTPTANASVGLVSPGAAPAPTPESARRRSLWCGCFGAPA